MWGAVPGPGQGSDVRMCLTWCPGLCDTLCTVRDCGVPGLVRVVPLFKNLGRIWFVPRIPRRFWSGHTKE